MVNLTKPCIKCGIVNRHEKNGSCLVCKQVRNAAYYQKNIEKMSLRVRPTKEKSIHYTNEWRKRNPEMAKAITINWQKANPDKVKAINQNRRARIKGNGGTLSTNIIQMLLTQQKRKCACCGLSLDNSYHLDHIMPLALGGKNDDNNVQLLTPKCNLSKGAKHPNDYMRGRGLLI